MGSSTVIVGMSGGVDSSVSAALLKEQGHRVIGLFMKNWEELDEKGQCTSLKDAEDVQKTCDLLQIPYYTVNFTQEYRDSVFKIFLEELSLGLTPNPDILCNQEIKFDRFLAKALEIGADFLATGHYCRTTPKGELLKGIDPQKDQSYFLYAVTKEALQKTLFPIGHLTKKEVRALAQKLALPTFAKKDSTGICFIGKRDFKPFVSQYLGYRPGPFKQLNGKTVGKHDGAAFYTIGQRKGLGLGGEGAAWYVVDKEISSNTVFVERGENHPALFSKKLLASQLTWIGDPPPLPCRLKAKIRYRQEEEPCEVDLVEENLLEVFFDRPQRAITPGQSIVFYQGEICLGGGRIQLHKITHFN